MNYKLSMMMKIEKEVYFNIVKSLKCICIYVFRKYITKILKFAVKISN